MTKIFLVYGHYNEKSFNAAIRDTFIKTANENGNEVGYYEVNILPGDFSVWRSCTASGDMNSDGELNISDIIIAVGNIVDGAGYNCSVDLNEDGSVDILDIVALAKK